MESQNKPASPSAESLYDAYETDPTLETDGAWVEFRAGVEVRLRSENSQVVRSKAAAIAKKQRHLILANQGQLPPKVQDENEIDLCARAIIVAWRTRIRTEGAADVVRDTLRAKDGTELPCTQENIRRVMKELPAFRRDILLAARVDETFKAQETEQMLGNSSTPSGPTSSTAAGV